MVDRVSGRGTTRRCATVCLALAVSLLLAYTASVWVVKAQTLQWNKTYGDIGMDDGYSVIQATDGGYMVLGWTDPNNDYVGDVYLVKTDSNGNLLWNKTYGEAGDSYGRSIIQASGGGYVIAGITDLYYVDTNNPYGDNNYIGDVYLFKIDPNGTLLWNKTYGGAKLDESASVIQAPDGGYAIAGFTNSYGNGSRDVYLIKTDQSGNMQWNKTYGGAGADEAFSIIQASDGGYVIAGITGWYGNGSSDVYLLKTDLSGNLLWDKTYGGAGLDEGHSLVRSSDGGYAIAGVTNSYGNGSYDAYLVKTDLNGDLLWNKTYGGKGADSGTSVIQASDGGYVIAGPTNSSGAGMADVYLIKTDLDGNLLWNKAYGGAGFDEGFSVIQDSHGDYVIAGITGSYGNGSRDVYLLKVSDDAAKASMHTPTPTTSPTPTMTQAPNTGNNMAVYAVILAIIVIALGVAYRLFFKK